MALKNRLYNLLRKSERLFKTDMVYLAKGGFWFSIGETTTILTALATAAAFANLIPPEVYGQYKYILSLAGIIGALSLTGMATAVTQAVARGFEGVLKQSYRTSLLWGSGMTMIAWSLALYYYFNENIFLATSLAAIGLLQPFLNSANLYGSFLNGRKMFKELAVLHFIRSFSFTTIIILMLLITNDPLLIVLTYFLFHTTIVSAFYFYISKKYKPNNKIDKRSSLYGKHLSVINILNVMASQVDKILIFHFLGAAQLAIYAFAIAIPEQIKAGLKGVSQLILPKFSEKKSVTELRKGIIEKSIRLGAIFGVIIIIYITSAPYLFSLLFPDYSESVFFSQLFATSLMLALGLFPVAALQSQMEQNLLYRLNITTALIQIAFIFAGVYYWGILGVVIARIASRSIYTTLAYVLLWVK